MQSTPRLYRLLTEDRRIWWALLWVNLLGSLYGFYWYWPQLRVTPWYEWIIVPDSPGSTFLFTILLFVMLRGGYWRWLAALGYVSLMKYGMWTAIVLPHHAIWAGFWLPEDFYLSASHLGMWFEGLLFSLRYPVGRAWAVVALGWMAFQDLVDYVWLGTHPTLPDNRLLGWAALTAVLLSLVWGGYLVVRNWREA